jgi:hypothetical protein
MEENDFGGRLELGISLGAASRLSILTIIIKQLNQQIAVLAISKNVVKIY